MRRNTALAVVAGLAIPTSAFAGQIGITVTVAGQQPTTTFRQVTSGQDITIDLATLTAATDVHVFDVLTNDTEDSLGMVTLVGDNAGNHIVRVAIATAALASVDEAFDNPANELGFGLKNLGGFQVLPSSGGVNPRDRTAVNISVRGDITGSVTSGRLFRIEAKRNDATATGGSISGDLRATAPDGQWSSSFPTFDFPAMAKSGLAGKSLETSSPTVAPSTSPTATHGEASTELSSTRPRRVRPSPRSAGASCARRV